MSQSAALVPGPNDPHATLLALRARAEQYRHLVTQHPSPEIPVDTQRLVQELQVHQIELEMQNEELLLAQAEAETARVRYLDLYDFAPVGYFTLSPAGQIEQLNLHASQLLGTERLRLVQRHFALFVAPAQRLEFEQFLARVLRTDATQSCELPLLRDDGTPFHGQLEGLRVATPAGLQCRLAVLDISARQQEVLAAILTTQETERKRIAEALHNGLGQLLYATKLSLEGRSGTPVSVRESLKLLEEAIRATRTISFELTPGILEDFGLRTALEKLAKRIAPACLPVRLHLTGLEQRLAPSVEIAVYRVVQELLNNVMKHARATEVVVHLVRESHRLEVSVEDDGCGCEPTAQAQQPLAGIGLSGVRNRVALLGGKLSVVSRLGRGTIISFGLAV